MLSPEFMLVNLWSFHPLPRPSYSNLALYLDKTQTISINWWCQKSSLTGPHPRICNKFRICQQGKHSAKVGTAKERLNASEYKKRKKRQRYFAIFWQQTHSTRQALQYHLSWLVSTDWENQGINTALSYNLVQALILRPEVQLSKWTVFHLSNSIPMLNYTPASHVLLSNSTDPTHCLQSYPFLTEESSSKEKWYDYTWNPL